MPFFYIFASRFNDSVHWGIPLACRRLLRFVKVKTEYMKVIDKLAWIEIKNKSILSTRSLGKQKFYIPGGKREQGENDEQALCREISEELSVELDVKTLRYIGTFEAQADSHPDGVYVKMTCYTADYTGALKACSEIESFEWLKYADKDKISAVDKLIFDFLKDRDLID